MLFNTRQFTFEGTIADLQELAKANQKLNPPQQQTLVVEKPLEKLPEERVEPVPKCRVLGSIQFRPAEEEKIQPVFVPARKKEKGKEKKVKPIPPQYPTLQDGELFAVSTQELNKGLVRISRIPPGKSSLPTLQNVLISPSNRAIMLTVIGNDGKTTAQIEICAAVKAEQQLCVNFRYLKDIVSKASSDYLIFSVENEVLRILAGQNSFALNMFEVLNYPDISDSFPAGDDVDVTITATAAKLQECFKRVFYSAAKGDVRWYLNGIFVEVNKDSPLLMMTTTDGHRLAHLEVEGIFPTTHSESKVTWDGFGIGMLLRMISFVEKTSIVKISYSVSKESQDIVVFRCENWKLSAICRNRFGEGNHYPDYHEVIPPIGGNDTTIVWKLSLEERANLMAALKAVSGTLNEKFNGVRLSFANGILTISSQSDQKGEKFASSSVVLETHISGENEIGFCVNYLIDALEGMGGDDEEVTLQLQGSYDSALFYRKGYAAVVMPMRL